MLDANVSLEWYFFIIRSNLVCCNQSLVGNWSMCMQGDNQMTNRIVVKFLNCIKRVYHFNCNMYTFSM